MRITSQVDPHSVLPTRASGGIGLDERSSARRARQQLVAEAVIASYIHDISVRRPRDEQQTRFGVRT
jgi:hypothetical protein